MSAGLARLLLTEGDENPFARGANVLYVPLLAYLFSLSIPETLPTIPVHF